MIRSTLSYAYKYFRSSNKSEVGQSLLAWAVAGNISDVERNGVKSGQRYRGTRVFSPGTKVFAGEIYWGMLRKGHFIGLNRVTKRFSNSVLDLLLIENLRVKSIYSQSEYNKLKKLECSLFETSEGADKLLENINGAIEFLRKEREEKNLVFEASQS
jgi:hypothetical protein